MDPNTRAFKPAPALAKFRLDRGVLPEHEVIAYQVGMRASHDLFTLHLLGYDKLRTYLGSWDEGNRDDLPVAVANTAGEGGRGIADRARRRWPSSSRTAA